MEAKKISSFLHTMKRTRIFTRWKEKLPPPLYELILAYLSSDILAHSERVTTLFMNSWPENHEKTMTQVYYIQPPLPFLLTEDLLHSLRNRWIG